MTMVRGEIITALDRRRRWSREEKEQLVAASFEPGVTVSEIARGAGMHASQLFRWRKELCTRSDTSEPHFLPVQIGPEPTASSTNEHVQAPPRRPGRPRKSSPIEIEIGGCRVRVDPDVDPLALRRVLDVLVSR
jgi:transposase